MTRLRWAQFLLFFLNRCPSLGVATGFPYVLSKFVGSSTWEGRSFYVLSPNEAHGLFPGNNHLWGMNGIKSRHIPIP